MLLPPSGPRSNCTALGLRFSEENWLNTPWAVKRTGGLTDTRTMSTSNRSMTVGVVRPSGRGLRTARPLPLVESLNGRPREVSGEDVPILLACARSAHCAPLAQSEAVSRPRAGRDEPRDLAVLARHRQLERRALQQPTRLRPQHGAHVRARHADVAVLEHDAELTDAPRGTDAAHRNVGDALQAIAADMHHGRERPRQYSAQLRAVPFLAPTEPRREVAVGVPAAARVGDRPQVGAALRRVERLLDRRRAAAAGGMKVGLDDRPVVLEHLARGAAYGGAIIEADRKSTRLNSSHSQISYAVFCLKKKKTKTRRTYDCDTRLPTAR